MIPYKGRILNAAKPVHVYRNLHCDQWSIRQNGLIIGHAEKIILRDVTFHVQPAGRTKVRTEGKKVVHAYVRGKYSNSNELEKCHVDNWLGDDECFNYRGITYNPYKYDTFVYRDDFSPALAADWVDMDITSNLEHILGIYQ